MAATTSPDPTEVRRRGRQRLIGAIAIVVLAVVFVPMVLDSEPRQDRKEPALTIPPKEGAPPLPAPTAQPAPAKAEPAAKKPTTGSDPLMPKVATPPAPKPPDPKIIAASEPKATPSPALPQGGGKTSDAPKGGASAPKLEGFAVQIGAFKDEEKLRQAREKLAAAKIPHFIERLAQSDLTRLRAGPYPTREAAEKARATITLAGLQGQIVPLP